MQPTMPRTLALFASARRYGNTGQFMDRIAAELGVEVVTLDALNLTPFDYEHRNRGDDFEPLMELVLSHQQIIFATPVYWYAVSPSMKVFLDRLSDFLELPDLLDKGRQLRGKTAFVVCTSISDEPSAAFMSAFTETFDYLGMRYGGVAHVNCADGYSAATHEASAVAFADVVRGNRATG